MSLEVYNINKQVEDCKRVLAEILLKSSKSDPLLLGICGGRSISKVLALIDSILLGTEKLATLLIDERALPLESPDTNYFLLNEELKGTNKIRDQINLVPFDIGNEEQSFEMYNTILILHNRIFDLVFLGVGEDGHVASIFPGLEVSHTVDKDFFVFEGSPKPPSKRFTASHSLIESSRNCILLLFGEGKRQAYQNLLDPSISTLECPAKYALSSNRTIIFTDIDLA